MTVSRPEIMVTTLGEPIKFFVMYILTNQREIQIIVLRQSIEFFSLCLVVSLNFARTSNMEDEELYFQILNMNMIKYGRH